MTELLSVPLDPQPLFPHEDITDKNAAMLELMLADRTLLQGLHVAAEATSKVFQVTHPALIGAANYSYSEVSRREAVDHGASTFEAISTLIQAPLPGDEDKIFTVVRKFLLASRESQYLDMSLSAAEKFRSELPNTAEVITSASSRYFAYLTEYAVVGAALTRRLELDSSDPTLS